MSAEGAPAPVRECDPRSAVNLVLKINDRDHRVAVDVRTTLLDTLREAETLAGSLGDRCEIAERSAADDVEDRAGRHRFPAKRRAGRAAAASEIGQRQTRGELQHAEAMPAKRRAALASYPSREVVGGPAR